jgi:hypothetical protein
MLDDTLLMLGAVSLLPRTGRGLTASLLVAYWVVRLSSSSVVYLKKSFAARRGGDGYALCVSLRMPLILVP